MKRLKSSSIKLVGENYLSVNQFTDGSREMILEESTLAYLYKYWDDGIEAPVLNKEQGWKGFAINDDGDIRQVNFEGKYSEVLTNIYVSLDELIQIIEEMQDKE